MGNVVVFGIFVADASYRTDRLPRLGETILGRGFTLGPGGKGSNQAVAAARAGATTTMLTRLGSDTFAAMARTLWNAEGIRELANADADDATGSAAILVESGSGNNAIIVVQGAAAKLTPEDVAEWDATIAGADIFVTQLETPMPATEAALARARAANVRTILNPAPAADLPDGLLRSCDLVTPNESEAEALTGLPVTRPQEALRAAERLVGMGAGAALVTLGARGVALHDGHDTRHFSAPRPPGPVIDTTGAGDAFTGALAAALAEAMALDDAVRFAQAAASLSVTRPGAAAALAGRPEIEGFLAVIDHGNATGLT